MYSQKDAVHFIAIGGIGMSALARILLAMGVQVSGSDIRETPLIRALEEQGATVFYGHDGENIPPACTEVVYSSAIREDNPEIVAALARQIPVLHRGELLARLFNSGRGVAVAGAHGKTTTSSMAALIYRKMNKSPNIILGGVLPFLGSNAEKGDSDIWVVEADESDGSFLKLQPSVTVVTNIEPEHLEHYGNLKKLHRAFADFVDGSEQAILCFDDPLTRELAALTATSVRSYGVESDDVELTARDIRFGNLCTSCTIVYKGEAVAELSLPVPGLHNINNALGAMFAAYLDGISFADSAACLVDFTGARRRFEILFRDDNVTLVDDYAHHPTEVRATISAAKSSGAKRVLAVFQPHRFSRVRDLWREFGAAFDEADVIIIDDIYSAWEDPCPGISSQLIVDEIRRRGKEPLYLGGRDSIIEGLKCKCMKGDLVLIMGAGDIRQTAERFCELLAEATAEHELPPGGGLLLPL